MNELLLKLSETEYIKITPDHNISLDEVYFCCGGLKAYFVSNNYELRIGQKSAGLFFEALIGILKKVVENKLQLDDSFTENLGYMYNEYFHDLPTKKPKFVMVPSLDGTSRYWIGYNYQIWSTYNDAHPYVTTWMYNDKNNDIIFEVSEFYKWSTEEDDLEDPEFKTYDDFMNDFKPLIHRTISRDVAIKWLEDSMKIYRSFFSTEENYLRAYKELQW